MEVGTSGLQGKVAVITGASRGLGAAVARRFAREGANLVLVARNIANLQAVSDEISKLSDLITLVQLDLQDFANIKDLAISLAAKFGSIDILVSNAATLGSLSPIQDYDYPVWKSVIDTNFNANWHLIKYFDPLLKQAPAGRAIFVTSEVASAPSQYPYWGPYAASKAALETMIKVYATETKHTRLCVNMVYPCLIDSGIYTTAFPGQDVAQLTSPDRLTDKFVELASEKCNVTGQTFKLSPSD